MESQTKQSAGQLSPHGVLIQSHHHDPGFRTATHEHPYHSLLYIAAGQGQYIIGDRQYDLHPNTAIVLKKGQPHQLIDKPGKAMVVFVVYFSRQIATANRQILDELFESQAPIAIASHQALSIRKSLRQMLHEQNDKDVLFEFAVRQCLSSILLDIYRTARAAEKSPPCPADASTARVAKILDHVEEQYYHPQSLAVAAKMAYLSQRQFTNICRKIKGHSFIHFVNSVRANRAADLLRQTKTPVSAIAFEVGFEELSTFYRAFKRYHKTSPLAFRKTSR